MSQDFTDDCFSAGGVWNENLQAMEDNFAALKSCFSGSTAPSSPVAGMLWLDTTNHMLKARNEANTAWLDIYDFANGRVPDSAACSGISINAGTGLSGGGALSTDRTLTHASHTGDVTGAAALTIVNGVVTPAKMVNYVAANDFQIHYDTGTSQGTSASEVSEVFFPRGGTIRTKMSLEGGFTGQWIRGRIYVNGSPVGTERYKLSGGYSAWTEDITISAGDYVQLYTWHTSDTYPGNWIFGISIGNPLTPISNPEALY